MDYFINFPFLALIPAALFLTACAHSQIRIGRDSRASRFVMLTGAVIWMLYPVYEFRVQGELKTENVPIRADLLVVYPALLGVTVAGLGAYLFGFRRRGGKG